MTGLQFIDPSQLLQYSGRKYGDVSVDACELKDLESANAWLKKIVAEEIFEIKGLMEVAQKKVTPVPDN